jgi:serine/threonine protein kinase
MERVVALKAIPVERIRDRETRMQFRDEVRTAARLTHPHIVMSYDANRHGNVWYLVMELVPGPNLQRLVVVNGPIAPPLAELLLRQAAEALRYAHGLGVIHCDIKPANLLIANAPGWIESELARAGMLAVPAGPPCVKILDFGIARLGELGDGGAKGWQREVTSGFGTPDYVAPEQAHDLNKADARSDLYSLGCTFYFAVTGRVPFPGDTALEKLIKHLAEQPAPIEQFCPSVPPFLAEVIRKLMAKHPSDRFQNAAELLTALETGAMPAQPARSLSSAPTVAEIIGV